MKLLSAIEFLGHFHPLLVHLPIGILLIGIILHWLSQKQKYHLLAPAVPTVLLAGCVTAFASCITGYLLSIADDYDKSLVSWHMWMGIGVTLVSLLLYAKEKNPAFAVDKRILSVGLLILLTITGHLGGSLTHGSDYLSKPLKEIFGEDSVASATIKPLANVQEAAVYKDIITPILQTRCYNCHNANKQKGGLRMDDFSLLMKGGKGGKVIVPGNADGSEMIKRLLLPTDNDDHMPPKEKPQLTESQVALLHWWISNNADAVKKTKETPQPGKIKFLLTALESATAEQKPRTDIPAAAVDKAAEKIIEQLKTKNIVVVPVAQQSNYLSVNFVTDSIVDKADLDLVVQLKPQLIWLKMNNTNLTDASLAVIGRLSNLTRLDLSNTLITNKGLPQLATLTGLQYLNLAGTKVSGQGISALKTLTKLQNLYLYKTNYAAKDWPLLKVVFPKTSIDTGGYMVPLLEGDTSLVKENIKK